MRMPAVMFLGLAFAAYWLLVGPPEEKALILAPVKPALVSVPNPPYDLEEPSHNGMTTPESKANLQKWLATEALRVGMSDEDPARTLARLKNKASGLARADLHLLKLAVLNRQLSADERFLAVYMLGLAGPLAVPALKELSFTRIPGLPNDRVHSDEVILRTQAIEGLVQLLSPHEARALLRDLLAKTPDPMVARHVQYWLNRLS